MIETPAFNRIHDYLGPWAMMSEAFLELWQRTERMDMRVHVAEFVPELKSVLEMIAGPAGKKIAFIRVQGILMKSQSSLGGTSTIQIRRDIRQAVNDPDVAGIMLGVDSPGGTVAGTDDLAREIKAARKAKPVWAAIEDLGASAAYWAASQAERITVNSPTALVGSIGTFQVVYDRSEMAANEGVRTLVFSTGPLKGMGVEGSKITDEQQTHVQSLVDSVQESFDAAIMAGRSMNKTKLKEVRHGGVLAGNAALEAGLVDAVQPLSKTLAEFSAAIKGGSDDYRRAMEIVSAGRYGIDADTGDIVAETPEPLLAKSEEEAQSPKTGRFSAPKRSGLPTLSASRGKS